MNLFELVIKNMRQRALSTWLTLVSVLLGVGLAVAIMILKREGAAIFGQTDYGFDILVGAKGSPLQLVLNTVYHVDKAPGAIPYSLYEKIRDTATYQQHVKIAVPFAVGDNYQGLPIMGTLTTLFGVDEAGKPLDPGKVLEYRPGKHYEIEQGRLFEKDKFEAVIGAEAAERAGLKLGSTFKANHGTIEKPDIHDALWTVVGILRPTHTAGDRVLYIPLTSFYAIAEHEPAMVAHAAVRENRDVNAAVNEFKKKVTTAATSGPTSKPAPAGELLSDVGEHHEEHGEHEEKHYTVDSQGHIQLQLPKSDWELTGVMIKSRSGYAASMLLYIVNNGQEATAVNPASTMRDFFEIFLRPSTLLLQLIVALTTMVAGVGICVSIYNSVSARLREIAILRALGATRTKVLALICVEAGLIGLVGGFGGLIAGHLLAAGISAVMERRIGEGFNWIGVGIEEWLYLVAVTVLALVAGLIPATKAYRTPVATNLVAA